MTRKFFGFWLLITVLSSVLYQSVNAANEKEKAWPVKDSKDIAEIERIFATIDEGPAGIEKHLDDCEEGIIFMAHDQNATYGIEAYKEGSKEFWWSPNNTIKHDLIEAYSYRDVVIARGKTKGTFQPKGSETIYNFRTKNMFVFKKYGPGELKIWQIIVSMSPNTD